MSALSVSAGMMKGGYDRGSGNGEGCTVGMESMIP